MARLRGYARRLCTTACAHCRRGLWLSVRGGRGVRGGLWTRACPARVRGVPVMYGRVPVLWITGPAGVGKSAVAWQLFTDLAQAGIRVAFANADQLCMCFPVPLGEPTREQIKAQNFGVLVPRYRAAGAQCVIANGCLDPHRGLYPELMPQADVTVCRLRADPQDVARRLTGRNGPGQDPDEPLEATRTQAEALDTSSFADACVDTTGVAAAGVARLVRDSCRNWPGFTGSLPKTPVMPGAHAHGHGDVRVSGDAGDADGQMLLICGPTGVGKSTIGFQLLVRYVNDGLMAGYIDLDQIGFVRPGSDDDPPARHR